MCAMHTFNTFKPFSMSGRCGPVSEVFSQRDLMVGLVSSSGVLQYLEFHELIHKATVVNTRLNEWSRSYILWEPICIKHWHLKPLKARFYTLVNPRQRCPVWTEHGTKGGSWCSAYIGAEKMLRNTFPIFAMRTKLHKGAGIRLNLFEPRYKWLAHRVTAAKDSQKFRFIYCTSVPQPGGTGWLTEMQQLRWSLRGSAQFIAVPISRCRLVEVWHESVPVNPYAPKLACCLAGLFDLFVVIMCSQQFYKFCLFQRKITRRRILITKSLFVRFNMHQCPQFTASTLFQSRCR